MVIPPSTGPMLDPPAPARPDMMTVTLPPPPEGATGWKIRGLSFTACQRDHAGACQVHDHGTEQDRIAAYGLCPVCRSPLDWYVEQRDDGWHVGSYCPLGADHETVWPLRAFL